MKQLKQAHKITKKHTKRQTKLAIRSLMIGSFSISQLHSQLTTWEPLKYRLITCLPRAFPVFLPFSFGSGYLHSAYNWLEFSSLVLSTLSCAYSFLSPSSLLCLLHPLNIVFMLFNALLWYQGCSGMRWETVYYMGTQIKFG